MTPARDPREGAARAWMDPATMLVSGHPGGPYTVPLRDPSGALRYAAERLREHAESQIHDGHTAGWYHTIAGVLDGLAGPTGEER